VVRIVFFALLFANLAYFAWAQWVDVPPTSPPSDISKLPRLKLAEEVGLAKRTEPGTAERTALHDPPGCLSVGPFPDSDAGARAAALLKGRGFDPRQRAEEGPSVEGYWVYVGGLKSETDADKALVTLEHGGIKDAVPMPENPDAGRRLSLGMFSERTRAEKRAQAVQEQTGLKVEIAERKLPGTVYWIDFAAPSGTDAVPLQDLFAEGSSSRVAVQPCPAPAGISPPPSPPPTGTATVPPSPHGAATAAASTAALAPAQLR
jgi:hypothetical protein